ncbi:hypothetical protein G6F33_013578 [Rhizopus arrhizus]|uniref:Uncharacterized protein n=1 Tax=Rhizopus oryzae TaxID=64495 RepID=A0A9P6WVE2_RHIOR|nr:hypothetical protein G6F33_013578 [Rhizopus arrhizus]KAG0981846.1 hypothetical protein G6F28_011323 [Rhizopus arrhizus]KAG1062636.1 hypothetical protein G6F41_011388 [Rhizopus arrhizus]KAG1293757.1 hypothetical protein G6F64_013515 [Rhizopus arrhizus]
MTAVDPIVSKAGNSIKKSGIVTRQTRSMTSQQTTADNSSLSGISNSQAKTTKALVCKHCFKEGHVRKSSKQCDKHEEYMAQLNESKSSQKQMMETSTDSTNNEDADMLSAEEGDSGYVKDTMQGDSGPGTCPT